MELYIDLPRQVEAFPTRFEDPFSVYELEPNRQTGKYSVRKYRQELSEDSFRIHCNKAKGRLADLGLYVEECNTLVTCFRLKGVEYDEMSNQCIKIYEEEEVTVPLNVCMRKRHASHYLNVNDKIMYADGRLRVGAPAICFN